MRPSVSSSVGSMICAFASFDSSSAMRPSMKPWRSRAASYSAFSERSPWARASAIAWITAGRSIAFSRCSSSLSKPAPRTVSGMVATLCLLAKNENPGSIARIRGLSIVRCTDRTAGVAGALILALVQFLQAVHLDSVLVAQALDRGPGAGDGGVERYALGQRGGPDGARIGDRAAPILDGVDHERDVPVDQQVDHVRTTVLDLVDLAHRQPGGGDRGR